MDYLCTIYTEGGPVCVLNYNQLKLWDGDLDYKHATGALTDGYSSVIRSYHGLYPVCAVRHESDGNFHVYRDSKTILLLSEIYAKKGHEIRRKLPSLAPWLRGKAPVKLGEFGGKIAVFDAALAGSRIGLDGVEFEHIVYPANLPDHQSAALCNVELGEWQVMELFCQLPVVSFSGVMFTQVT